MNQRSISPVILENCKEKARKILKATRKSFKRVKKSLSQKDLCSDNSSFSCRSTDSRGLTHVTSTLSNRPGESDILPIGRAFRLSPPNTDTSSRIVSQGQDDLSSQTPRTGAVLQEHLSPRALLEMLSSTYSEDCVPREQSDCLSDDSFVSPFDKIEAEEEEMLRAEAEKVMSEACVSISSTSLAADTLRHAMGCLDGPTATDQPLTEEESELHRLGNEDLPSAFFQFMDRIKKVSMAEEANIQELVTTAVKVLTDEAATTAKRLHSKPFRTSQSFEDTVNDSESLSGDFQPTKVKIQMNGLLKNWEDGDIGESGSVDLDCSVLSITTSNSDCLSHTIEPDSSNIVDSTNRGNEDSFSINISRSSSIGSLSMNPWHDSMFGSTSQMQKNYLSSVHKKLIREMINDFIRFMSTFTKYGILLKRVLEEKEKGGLECTRDQNVMNDEERREMNSYITKGTPIRNSCINSRHDSVTPCSPRIGHSPYQDHFTSHFIVNPEKQKRRVMERDPQLLQLSEWHLRGPQMRIHAILAPYRSAWPGGKSNYLSYSNNMQNNNVSVYNTPRERAIPMGVCDTSYDSPNFRRSDNTQVQDTGIGSELQPFTISTLHMMSLWRDASAASYMSDVCCAISSSVKVKKLHLEGIIFEDDVSGRIKDEKEVYDRRMITNTLRKSVAVIARENRSISFCEPGQAKSLPSLVIDIPSSLSSSCNKRFSTRKSRAFLDGHRSSFNGMPSSKAHTISWIDMINKYVDRLDNHEEADRIKNEKSKLEDLYESYVNLDGSVQFPKSTCYDVMKKGRSDSGMIELFNTASDVALPTKFITQSMGSRTLMHAGKSRKNKDIIIGKLQKHLEEHAKSVKDTLERLEEENDRIHGIVRGPDFNRKKHRLVAKILCKSAEVIIDSDIEMDALLRESNREAQSSNSRKQEFLAEMRIKQQQLEARGDGDDSLNDTEDLYSTISDDVQSQDSDLRSPKGRGDRSYTHCVPTPKAPRIINTDLDTSLSKLYSVASSKAFDTRGQSIAKEFFPFLPLSLYPHVVLMYILCYEGLANMKFTEEPYDDEPDCIGKKQYNSSFSSGEFSSKKSVTSDGLTNLSLSFCGIGAESLMILLSYLADEKKDLSECSENPLSFPPDLEDTGCSESYMSVNTLRYFGNIKSSRINITSLDISYNLIDYKCLIILCALLPKTFITTLSLRHNDLSGNGYRADEVSFRPSSSANSTIVDHHHIIERKLVTLISSESGLEKLDISFTRLSTNSKSAVMRALTTSTLLSISLEGLQFTTAESILLFRSLDINTTLTSVSVGFFESFSTKLCQPRIDEIMHRNEKIKMKKGGTSWANTSWAR